MGKAVGGYVRRCERKPYYEPRLNEAPYGYMHFSTPNGGVVSIAKEGPMIQAMPVLRFEQFDVSDHRRDDEGNKTY